MTVDFALTSRTLLNLAPRWVRVALLASVVVGMCAKVAHKVFEPALKGVLRGIADVSALDDMGWLAVGLTLTFPVVWFWRLVTRADQRRGPKERAEEFIETMKRAMDEADLPAADRKFYWRSVFGKLADSFKIDAEVPRASEIAVAVDTERTHQR